jgi:hypothetical protein
MVQHVCMLSWDFLQAHKFLTGLAPVHSLVRMGSAVGVVASAMGPSGPVGRHLTRGAHVALEASAGATSMLCRLGQSQLAMQVCAHAGRQMPVAKHSVACLQLSRLLQLCIVFCCP